MLDVSTDTQEDSRLERPGLCRVSTFVGTKEFICIREAHAKIYNRHNSSPVGAPIFDNNPNADRHYFVRRYPFGDH